MTALIGLATLTYDLLTSKLFHGLRFGFFGRKYVADTSISLSMKRILLVCRAYLEYYNIQFPTKETRLSNSI